MPISNDQLAAFVAKLVSEQAKAQNEHFDTKLQELKDEVNAKIDPMHDYFTTAKTNVTVFKWAVGIGGGLVLMWQGFKEWFK